MVSILFFDFSFSNVTFSHPKFHGILGQFQCISWGQVSLKPVDTVRFWTIVWIPRPTTIWKLNYFSKSEIKKAFSNLKFDSFFVLLRRKRNWENAHYVRLFSVPSTNWELRAGSGLQVECYFVLFLSSQFSHFFVSRGISENWEQESQRLIAQQRTVRNVWAAATCGKLSRFVRDAIFPLFPPAVERFNAAPPPVWPWLFMSLKHISFQRDVIKRGGFRQKLLPLSS